jgi:hypothetical protein
MLLTLEPIAAASSAIKTIPTNEVVPEAPLAPWTEAELVAEQIKEQQPQRWATFHASQPRILVYDNNPRTKMRYGIALEQLYGKPADEAEDHQQVISLVRERARLGQPYQLLVIDMHLGDVLGTDVIKQLGRDCPAVVFITTSIGLAAFGDLKIQMERYDSESALRLISQHVEDRQQLGIPLAPVFGHLKHASWAEFALKADSALFLASQRPASHAAMEEFLKVFVPRRLPITVSTLCAHNLVEEVINALDRIDPLVHELKQNHDLGEHSWWHKNGRIVEGALEVLRGVRYSKIETGSSVLTWQQVHELVGEFDNLSAADLTFPEDPAAQRLAQLWQKSFQRYQREISVIANELRAYVQGQVSISRTLEIAANKYGLELVKIERQDPPQSEPLVLDPEYPLSTFIDQACAAFGCPPPGNVPSPGLRRVSFQFVPEAQRVEEPVQISQTLKQIEAGAYFEIAFIDQSGAPLEQTFADVLRMLPLLRERQQCCFRVEEEPATPSRLRLFIKASEVHNDSSQYRQEALAAAANPNEVIPQLAERENLRVYRLEGSNGQITCLGDLPQMLDLGLGLRGRSETCGLVYEIAGATIFASADSHKLAARLIHHYLESHSAVGAPSSQAAAATSENEILREGVRVSKIPGSGMHIEPDAVPGKAERARGALIELGLMPERAQISAKYFQAEKAISGTEPATEPARDAASLPEYKRQWFSFEEFASERRRLLIEGPLKTLGEETIRAYEQIAVGPSVNEPSFFIRSTQGLNLEQQRKLCHTLLPIMQALDLSAWAVSDFAGQVAIEGSSPRKSGLFLYDPQYRGRTDESDSCSFARQLKPLIEQSSSSRFGFDGILRLKAAELVPANSLIYGAGDHSLSGCKAQWGLALAIELALQAAGVPYDSIRGSGKDPQAQVSFNGTTLEANVDLSGMLQDSFELRD